MVSKSKSMTREYAKNIENLKCAFLEMYLGNRILLTYIRKSEDFPAKLSGSVWHRDSQASWVHNPFSVSVIFSWWPRSREVADSSVY